MKKVLKTFSILAIIFIIILIAFLIWFCNFDESYNETVITTSYGDEFNLSFDSFKIKTLIEDNNSRFYTVINDKVTKEDFKEICNTEHIKIYNIKNCYIFDIGNGFETYWDKENIYTDDVKAIQNKLLLPKEIRKSLMNDNGGVPEKRNFQC